MKRDVKIFTDRRRIANTIEKRRCWKAWNRLDWYVFFTVGRVRAHTLEMSALPLVASVFSARCDPSLLNTDILAMNSYLNVFVEKLSVSIKKEFIVQVFHELSLSNEYLRFRLFGPTNPTSGSIWILSALDCGLAVSLNNRMYST